MIKKYFFLTFILYIYNISICNANILVSIKPLGFIVSAITNNTIPIEVLVPNGESEHNYFLKFSDLQKIKNTDMLVWISPEIESFLTKPSSFLISKKNNLIISEIPEIKNLIVYSKNNNFDKKINNMHLWLSPEIAKIIAFSVYKKLSILMPQKKDFFLYNLQQFRKELENVNKKIFKKFKSVKEKKYIVLHDSFTYFEKYYGLSPPTYSISLNHFITPGIKVMHEIHKTVINNNIVCIFLEPQYNYSFINKIIHNYPIKTGIIDPLGNDIFFKKNSYINFLLKLSDEYVKCLK